MSRRLKITWKKIEDWIKEGRGQGFGKSYRPWLKITRTTTSPMSIQKLQYDPLLNRQKNLLSKGEWSLALLYTWAGAEVREQYPMWPWRHRHPLDGMDTTSNWDWPHSRGLLDLCRAHGIDHGVWIGTKIPYIWTIDLALTVLKQDGTRPDCVFISVKPLNASYVAELDPLSRVAEKFEIERLYSKEMNIRHFIGDQTLFPGPLIPNLECLKGCATLSNQPFLKEKRRLFIEKYSDELVDRPPLEWVNLIEQEFGCSFDHADRIVKNCLWTQVIDSDLSRKKLNMSEVPRPGGYKLRKKIIEKLSS